VAITWEDDCRWMTVTEWCRVRGECNMGSVYSAVEDSVDGSAGGQVWKVFGQWSRASGGRTQEIFQDTAVTLNRTEQERQDIFDFVRFFVVSVDDRPRTTTEPLVASARPASTREQACE
jgi:hypothetical protein